MTDQELLKFSQEHLSYEIYSLYAALELFAKGPVLDPAKFVEGFNIVSRNLFLEGVITHSRCLYEFLYFERSKKFPDDARATDFFESPESWIKLRPEIPPHFKEFYDRAGEEVVHMSFNRLDKTQITKRWDLYTLTNDLFTTLLLFANNANPRKLHPHVKRDLEFWRQRTGYEPGQTKHSVMIGSSSPIVFPTLAITSAVDWKKE